MVFCPPQPTVRRWPVLQMSSVVTERALSRLSEDAASLAHVGSDLPWGGPELFVYIIFFYAAEFYELNNIMVVTFYGDIILGLCCDLWKIWTRVSRAKAIASTMLTVLCEHNDTCIKKYIQYVFHATVKWECMGLACEQTWTAELNLASAMLLVLCAYNDACNMKERKCIKWA